MILCGICKHPFVRDDAVMTVRQRWVNSGGDGPVPDDAVVHPGCDFEEQQRDMGYEPTLTKTRKGTGTVVAVSEAPDLVVETNTEKEDVSKDKQERRLD